MWWITVAIVVAFLIVMFLALCAAQEKLPPEEELRLIREQAAERERLKALRKEARRKHD
jgi:hypothetical protein